MEENKGFGMGFRKHHVFYIGLAVVLVLSLVNIVLLQQRFFKIEQAKISTAELQKPTSLQLVRIEASGCPDCFKVDNVIAELKKKNVNVTADEKILSESERGIELIKKYRIEKLPTFIVLGEINRTEQLLNYFNEIGVVVDNGFIFDSVKAPYYSVKDGKIVGRVASYHIRDNSCTKCEDMGSTIKSLKESGVSFSNLGVIDYSSKDAKSLIFKYGIKRIPALLLSDDIDYYPEIKQALAQLGVSKKDGFYALHSSVPPYRNITTDKIDGLVQLITIKDETCKACYNYEINKQILQSLGVLLISENTYDISSVQGKELIAKYKIQKVPMILLSSEASAYNNFVLAWQGVGTKESDGWFIMRTPENLGAVKDIETGQVISSRNLNSGEQEV